MASTGSQGLIFPIRFDFDKAVRDASGNAEKVLKIYETAIKAHPITIPLSIDASKGSLAKELQGISGGAGSINNINKEMRKLIEAWNNLSEAERVANQQSGEYTQKAKDIINRYMELTAATKTYAQSLTQIAAAAQKAAATEQSRIEKQKAHNDAITAALSMQAKTYEELKTKISVVTGLLRSEDPQSSYWGKLAKMLKELNVKMAEYQSQEKKATGVNTQRERTIAMLKAEETNLANVNAKLKYYQSMMNNAKSNSQFEYASRQVTRLSEKLAVLKSDIERVNQQLKDFQQASFKGLNVDFTRGQVEKLTHLRNELEKIDRFINRQYQSGRAYVGGDSKNGFTDTMKGSLESRMNLTREINNMLKTGYDLQIEREKEISRIQEQRKAKAQAIADKKKAEIQEVQRNIAKLKEERAVLNQQESTVKAITDKLAIMQQRLNTTNMKSGDFEKVAKEVERLTIKLDRAKAKIDELTGRAVESANKQKAAQQQVTQEYNKQSLYIERLIQRMAVYASVSYLDNFLSNIREVTSQFELQKTALGAIIQDQNRANALFTQVKGLALESPFKILDLTKYTKQLAAYQIETDKLFDTMKSLADISAGLGVSMDRLILAYGQVKATGHLRASEVRQFTEAGLPIVSQLAEKLSQVNKELVTTADVQDMISKRQISFEMVADIFEDMTKKGGLFYDMQKVQGETLYGLWQKLGDAASLMYDGIGTTPAVMKVMKLMIEAARSLMLNWKQVGSVLGVVSAGIIVYVIQLKNAKLATKVLSAENLKYVASLKAEEFALKRKLVPLRTSISLTRVQTQVTLWSTRAQIAAATATNIFTKALYGLKTVLLANPLTFIATAALAIIAYFWTAENEADRLAKSLEEIDDRYAEISRETQRDLPKLAKEAVNAADGSKKQRDALEELSRVYGQIIPQELLTIENLRAMRGEYDGLIALVDDYNTKRKYEERESQIKQSYDTSIKDAEDDLRDWLNAYGIENTDPRQTQIVQAIKDKVANGVEAMEATRQALEEAGLNWERHIVLVKNALSILNGERYLDAWEAIFNNNEVFDLANQLAAKTQALDENDAAMGKELAEMQRFEKYVNDATIAIDSEADSLLKLKMALDGNIADTKLLDERLEDFKKSEIWAPGFIINEDEYADISKKVSELKYQYKLLNEEYAEYKTYNSPDTDEHYSNNIEGYEQRIAELKKQIEQYQNELSENIFTIVEMYEMASLDNMPFDEQVQEGIRWRCEKIKDIIQEALLESGVKADISEWGEEVNGQWVINFEKLIEIVKKQSNDTRLLAAILNIQAQYKKLVPEDSVTKAVNSRIMDIAHNTGMSMNIIYECLKNSAEDWEEYAKRVKDSIEKVLLVKIAALKGEIADLTYDLKDTSDMTSEEREKAEKDLKNKKDELKQAQKDLKGVQQVVVVAEQHTYKEDKKRAPRKSGGGSSKKDDRLQNLQEIEQTLSKINSEYEKLDKQEGKSRALKDINAEFANTLDYINQLGKPFGLHFEMPTDFATLQQYRKNIMDVIANLKKATGTKKAVLELETKIGAGQIDKLAKQAEKQLKEIADKVSRTKTAKDFYNTILESTGDIELSAKISVGIYKGDGWDLKKDIADQIREYFKDERLSIEIPFEVISSDNYINYTSLLDFIEKHKSELGEKPYEELKKLAQKGQDEMAKRWKAYYKDIQKTEDYAQKISKIEQDAAEKIRQIREDIANNPSLKEQGEQLISDILKKQMQDINKLEWEVYQTTALYVQMFDDLEYASTYTLTQMRNNMEYLSKNKWSNMLSPTEIKEVQNSIAKIDEQLMARNPWKALKESFNEYRSAVNSATKEGAQSEVDKAKANVDDLISNGENADSMRLIEAQQELEAQQKIFDIVSSIQNKEGERLKGKKALLAVQQKAFLLESQARSDLDVVNQDLIDATNDAQARGVDPAKDENVIAATLRVKEAEKEYNLMLKIADILAGRVKTESKLRKSVVAAGEATVGWLNAGQAFAQGIADSMEALGADENDVQYFSDIAQGLGDITAGVQGFVDAAMAANLPGMVTSLISVVPNMIKGFSTLFSAGRIRRANKEIKKQEELLEELQYAYERLEKAADKLFGTDYINNYNKQLEILQAEQAAYLKQAEAERSKGKKADKEKIKDYENSARDTANEILDMENAIIERMTGTERANLAKEWADSWLAAKVAFENTTDDIKSSYRDMIKSMIIEGAAAKIIDAILQPMWDKANVMLQKGQIDEALDYVIGQMDTVIGATDNAMNTFYQGLQAKGYDVRDLLSDDSSVNKSTGIKREYATASEESINGLAAAANTQNWYISHVPRINEHVQSIREYLEGSGTMMSGNICDLTEIQRQALSNLQGIERHTAETVTECKRIASACEKQVSALNSVIISANSKSNRGIQVFMRN